MTTTTDANGNYQFQFLLPGTYEVDETVPATISPKAPRPAPSPARPTARVLARRSISQIAVLGGDNSISNNFALVQPASISGNVADCLADKPLSGVTVELLNSSGTVIANHHHR